MSLQYHSALAWFGDSSTGWLAVLSANLVKSGLVLGGAALVACALKRASAAVRHLAGAGLLVLGPDAELDRAVNVLDRPHTQSSSLRLA